jgi:hypothetical protein
MQDPNRPAEPLIQVFMNGYYGAAGAKMREYLKFMEDNIAASSANLSAMKCYARPYLTLPFFLACERLLDEAEGQCRADAKALLHVRRERLPVDAGLCHLWDNFARSLSAGQKLPFDRELLLKRYESYRLEQMQAYRTAATLPQAKAELADEMERFRASDIPLPEQFRKLATGSFRDFTWPSFHGSGQQSRLVADPDAAGGKALQYIGEGPKDHERPLNLGVYDRPRRVFGPSQTLKGADVPQDEKYHWHKVGRFPVTDGTLLWVHWTWLLSVDLDRVYDPAEQDRQCDIWISLKVTGPAYVKGSKQPNAVSMDRIIVTRAK